MGADEEKIAPVTAPENAVEGIQVIEKAHVHDIGASLYLEVQQYSPEELEIESKKVLRLLDWYIMPMVRNLCQLQLNGKLNR